jgi:UDP-GlcNAc:undecaprenyl-phosphate GlcNAc-1-phosphate transferase
MYQLKLPFAGFVVLGPSILPLITAAWVFALTNAVNLIDGLDGLAAGIVAIASGTLCIYGLRLEDLGLLPVTNVGPLIAALTCGICLGFLRDNFHPAKLFMGDAGALMLGLLMSASTMVIGGRTPPASGVTFFFFAPLFIPVFILGVPLMDAVWAFVRRTVSGQGFHTPDKNHIHHRLMRLGHGQRRTVIILWLWTGLLCGFVLFPLFEPRFNVFIPVGVAILVIGLFFWSSPWWIRRRARQETTKTSAKSRVK